MKKGAITLLGSAITIALLSAPSVATPFSGGDGQSEAASSKSSGGMTLASAIMADIGNRAATASSADLEGFMIYVISQGDYSLEDISDALDRVGAGATGNMKTAVDNVRTALLKRKLKRGTAAILNGNGGSFGSGGSGFSSPGVSVGGGGGSNYTS